MAQTNVPVTRAFYFSQGQVASGKYIIARNGASVANTQMDVKTRHADNSVAHAIISYTQDSLSAASSITYTLDTSTSAPSGSTVNRALVLASNFDCTITVTISGTAWSASAKTLLTADSNPAKWLEGPICTEFHVKDSLKDGSSNKHPHLMARFYIRYYTSGVAWVRVILENCRTYKDANDVSGNFKTTPSTFQDYTGDVVITVQGSGTVQTNNAFRVVRQTRHTSAFWWNRSTPLIDVDPAGTIINRLKSDGLVPNYVTGTVSSGDFDTQDTDYTNHSAWGNIGLMYRYMPDTGGRADIGPLPRWDARLIRTWNRKGFNHVIGTSERAGSWQIHYRDESTDYPPTLDNYTYFGTLSQNNGDCNRPSPSRNEQVPATASGGTFTAYVVDGTSITPDTAHQPRVSYLAYLLTGDYYHLEELQMWANWNLLNQTPAYRNFGTGYLHRNQLRGFAWSLLALGYAWKITPDSHTLKSYFDTKLQNNITRMFTRYVDNPAMSPLGIYTDGNAMTGYDTTDIDNDGINDRSFAPWMMGFLTVVIGELDTLGVSNLDQIRDWITKFFTYTATDADFCQKDITTYYMLLDSQERSLVGSSTGPAYEYVYDQTNWPNNPKELLAKTDPFYTGVHVQITGVTQANPAVVTMTDPTGYSGNTTKIANGMSVRIYSVGGMTQLNGNTYTVANKTSTTFELQGINSTGYGAYTSGGYAHGDVSSQSHIGNCSNASWANVADPESYTAIAMAALASCAEVRQPAEAVRSTILTAMNAASAPLNSECEHYITPRSVPSAHALETMTIGRFNQHGNNVMDDVKPNVANNGLSAISAGQWSTIQASSGFAGILAYSGGCYDAKRNRIIVWGGGHGDYYGNEMYAFSLDTMLWTRLFNPGPQPYSSESYIDVEILSDGSPTARHTANTVVHVPDKDAVYCMGGHATSGSSGGPLTRVFKRSFGSNIWVNVVALPTSQIILCAAYDPARRVIWCRSVNNLYAFNVDTETFEWNNTELAGEYMYYAGMGVDPAREKVIIFGHGFGIHYDISGYTLGGGGTVTRSNPVYTDPNGYKASTRGAFAYCPDIGKFVQYHTGTELNIIDHVNNTVTTVSAVAGGATPDNYDITGSDGKKHMHGRFGYIPKYKCFYAVTKVTQAPYFWRMSNP